ncbi:MAG: phenylacetate--CoA ligase family protein [Halanaeroarchaeum sp.]
MAHFDDVVTDTAVERADVEAFVADPSTVGERFLGRYPVWTTSGTTGEPGIFLQDDRSMLATDAAGDRWALSAFLDRRTIARLLRGGARIAEIAVGGHYAAASGVELFRREHPFLRDRMRLVSPDQPLDTILADLQAYQPAILVGYASVLLELERAQRAGDLSVQPASIAPSGEPITSEEKDRLRETFGATVREIYGATEFYGLGVECAHGDVHANTDWVVLEPVDADYRPVAPGEPAETVLLTNLANRVQPLVRYDLGDSVTLSEERCACDSPFPVVEVAGRQGEVLHFETAGGESVPLFPLALTSVVKGVPGTHRFQLVKTGAATLTVRLSVESGADEATVWSAVEAALTDSLAAKGLESVAVELADEPPARNSRSGKFQHVWSAV